jgi:hypothetical protein
MEAIRPINILRLIYSFIECGYGSLFFANESATIN